MAKTTQTKRQKGKKTKRRKELAALGWLRRKPAQAAVNNQLRCKQRRKLRRKLRRTLRRTEPAAIRRLAVGMSRSAHHAPPCIYFP
jgi:hypothetical protein